MGLKNYSKQYGLKFSLEESPAESATRRFALINQVLFPELSEVIKGTREDPYLTNSVHLTADAPVDLITRIRKQAAFHPAIDSGAIIHAFLGEQRPPAASIRNLVEKSYRGTQAAQLTLSPEFTVCEDCKTTTPKLLEKCPIDEKHATYGVSRIVGYYSKIPNWNRSKLKELQARHAGIYLVEEGQASQILMDTEMPELEKPSKPGEILVHRFRKPESECHPCADLGRTIAAVAKRYENRGVSVKEIYHRVTEEEGFTESLAGDQIPRTVCRGNDGV